MGGKTFQQYLGLYWDILKDKYLDWLNSTYSKSLLRIFVYCLIVLF